ncbi:uncharacterized protein LOC114333577 isoform X1 [Diabrotica virgifera virgifera]|uniref:Uncharacterized protein LOC114333577 isoform X1 n=1 Tax=Diabrotica virgifera virgifera TaxID=50390 RepID=A0A6P7FWU2_DIAVI|nr:uncharacterized protein LOC114333577 isoform X1 [Diabrotica virgifera virgifera]
MNKLAVFTLLFAIGFQSSAGFRAGFRYNRDVQVMVPAGPVTLEAQPAVQTLEAKLPAVQTLEARPLSIQTLEAHLPEIQTLEARPEVQTLEARPAIATLEARPEVSTLELRPEVSTLELSPEVSTPEHKLTVNDKLAMIKQWVEEQANKPISRLRLKENLAIIRGWLDDRANKVRQSVVDLENKVLPAIQKLKADASHAIDTIKQKVKGQEAQAERTKRAMKQLNRQTRAIKKH